MGIPTLRAAARIGATALLTLAGTHSAIGRHSASATWYALLKPCSPDADLTALAETDPDARRVNAEVDSIFRSALAESKAPANTDPYDQITLLGKLIIYDKTLSARQNLACASCHIDDTGFTGAVEAVNKTVVAYPNSTRAFTGPRKPQSYGYAPFAPVLHYNRSQQDFQGGNFWDMDATGVLLDNPAAEQAKGPPLNPLEMALPDQACAVYRISRGQYRRLFERVWGPQSFAIEWPANVEAICSTPGPAPSNDTLPVHLNPRDRGIAASTYNNMVLAIASYEASPEVSAFSSKFDSALAHPDRQILTGDELAGWALFRGKARCNTCHVDGTSSGNGRVGPADAADVAPLFTDFTSANIGVPKNTALRYYCQDKANAAGYTPNPDGMQYVDRGVGGFLRSSKNPNREWARYADRFDGAMRVPTLRNVDMRPRPDFVKPYMHNGYFKSLKEVVHFYNTRNVLPRCRMEGDPGEKKTCWPAPEVAANVDTTIGKLGLTPREEDQIVAFLKTLTDRPQPR